MLFDGAAAPLVYVSERQIAVMAPYGIAGKSTTQVQVWCIVALLPPHFRRPLLNRPPASSLRTLPGKAKPP